LEEKGLLPQEHIVDSGFIDAEVLAKSQDDYEVTLLGPVAVDSSWQAQEGKGFDVTHFPVDWQKQQVSCPTGKQSRSWTNAHDRHGKEVIHIKFHPSLLPSLPLPSTLPDQPNQEYVRSLYDPSTSPTSRGFRRGNGKRQRPSRKNTHGGPE
jgi:hypothetical protein